MPPTYRRQRALHLAANAVRNRRREQPDARRQRSHQHRPHPLLGTPEYGVGNAQAPRAELTEIGDVENAVHNGDAKQGDKSDRGRNAEVAARKTKRNKTATDRTGIPATASRRSRSELNNP